MTPLDLIISLGILGFAFWLCCIFLPDFYDTISEDPAFAFLELWDEIEATIPRIERKVKEKVRLDMSLDEKLSFCPSFRFLLPIAVLLTAIWGAFSPNVEEYSKTYVEGIGGPLGDIKVLILTNLISLVGIGILWVAVIFSLVREERDL